MESGYERQTYPRRGELRENRGVSRRIIEQEGGPQPRSTIFVFSPGPNQPMAHCRSERTKGAFLSQCDGKPKRCGSPARVLRTRRAIVQASGRGGGEVQKSLFIPKKKQVYILGLGFQAGFCNDHWVVGPLSKTMRARRSSLEGVIGRGR